MTRPGLVVRVDPRSPVPVFEQLRAQIALLIASGGLRPGDRLPPIRQLAGDLDIARGTVNKVYDALARDGLVETAGRHGTTVLGAATSPVRGLEAQRALADAATSLAVVARQLCVDEAAAHRALDDALRRV